MIQLGESPAPRAPRLRVKGYLQCGVLTSVVIRQHVQLPGDLGGEGDLNPETWRFESLQLLDMMGIRQQE